MGKKIANIPHKDAKGQKNGKIALPARHGAAGKNFGVFREFHREMRIVSRTAFYKRANDAFFPAGLRPALLCECVIGATTPAPRWGATLMRMRHLCYQPLHPSGVRFVGKRKKWDLEAMHTPRMAGLRERKQAGGLRGLVARMVPNHILRTP